MLLRLPSLRAYPDTLTCPAVHRASVIGLYTSYVVPIFLRITSGRNKLVPGPFSLGKWSMPIGAVAFAWVTFIVVLLLFPAGESVSGADMSTLTHIGGRLV